MKDLLSMMFEHQRWKELIEKADEKGIKQVTLKQLCTPQVRVEIVRAIADGRYTIAPAHIARIPKDKPGEFREVHVNEDVDRVILTLINDCLLEMFPHMIHPNCTSYQKGKGCQQTVANVSKYISNTEGVLGVKADLTKYFDSVKREVIFNIFDRLDIELGNEIGSNPVIKILRDYYNMDKVFDLEGNLIEHYGSLKQGCAVASFLSNVVLYDVDDELSNMEGIMYCRYSDDLLILGRNHELGKAILEKRLKDYGLSLNPSKVEVLSSNEWFKFLGFSLKGEYITLSKGRIKSFQKEIVQRTLKSNVTETTAKKLIMRYLYEGEYNWASSCLGLINCEKDIQELNLFIMDCIRAVKVRNIKGKKGCLPISAIGGLGVVTNLPDRTILRGTGRNVTRNRLLTERNLTNYISLDCLRKVYIIDKNVFRTLIQSV